ncbi:glucan synthase-like 1 [Actinidia rufa]|uniref:Glucan synthase-like 1 n=1 Tax=Actinidia rufa TaxID=165716 RepID=A0A7J0G608_9ERIC|nr:glucan synthase-like 1 [Actinidia rufa]
MNLRQRPIPTRRRGEANAPPPLKAEYNIIPIHNLLTDHPSLRIPEVRAAAAALRTASFDLRKPPFIAWHNGLDLVDWLGFFFGFQRDNVRNQREHLVLHLANSQMRPPLEAVRPRRRHTPGGAPQLPQEAPPQLHLLVLLPRPTTESPPLQPPGLRPPPPRTPVYRIDENTGSPFVPPISGENAFLNRVIAPIYNVIKTEVERSRNGTAPHSAWRNYDDINEFFWSRRCFRRLNWPIDRASNFFATTRDKRVGKTGFVEQRTFWNVFRSFDRVWVLLFLFLQAAIIVAWEGKELLQSVLDAGTQYSLVSKETVWLGVRMVLKGVVASTWIIVFFCVLREDLEPKEFGWGVFNLKPDEENTSPQATVAHKLRDAIHRLKLRYGLGQPYKKIESSQVEATRFALIWNEIIITMREEDIISDTEWELMELPPNCWDIRVIRWPCFLLCNELLLALGQAGELGDSSDRGLWFRMCKNEYTRCAVIEAYDSIRYLFREIIKYNTEEYSIVSKFFTEIDHDIEIEKFIGAYKMTVLPQIHTQLVSLIELLLMPKKDLSKVVNVLQALYELSVREFPNVKKSIAQLRQDGMAPTNPATDSGLLFENAVQFPDDEDAMFYKQLRHSTISAALAIGYVGKKGNTHAGWLPICGQVPKFCDRVTGALISGFIAAIIYFLLLLYSLHNVINLLTANA